MSRTEAISAAKAAGFTHIATLAGPIQLDAWTPYGKSGEHRVQFSLDGDRLRETKFQPSAFGFMRGVWPLIKSGSVVEPATP